MQPVSEALARLGLSEKEIAVYLALLSVGPSPIRRVAEAVGINRGTTHAMIRALQKRGLVSYYHKATHQYFVAEEPDALLRVVERQRADLTGLADQLRSVLPQLRALTSNSEERPVVKYYEGVEGIRTILEHVLDETGKLPAKAYAVYSSANLRSYLYQEAFPSFTEERKRRGIFVRAMAIGAGGRLAGLDERRWLTRKGGAPTYTLLYAGRVAMISLDRRGAPRGVIIEDAALFATQQLLFDWMWEALGRS